VTVAKSMVEVLFCQLHCHPDARLVSVGSTGPTMDIITPMEGALGREQTPLMTTSFALVQYEMPPPGVLPAVVKLFTTV
jgi:hypothetical protein